jgi:hypothetical protein
LRIDLSESEMDRLCAWGAANEDLEEDIPRPKTSVSDLVKQWLFSIGPMVQKASRLFRPNRLAARS